MNLFVQTRVKFIDAHLQVYGHVSRPLLTRVFQVEGCSASRDLAIYRDLNAASIIGPLTRMTARNGFKPVDGLLDNDPRQFLRGIALAVLGVENAESVDFSRADMMTGQRNILASCNLESL